MAARRDGIEDEGAAGQRGQRLQKVLAAAGVASRRDCERMILDGRVRVNGQTVSKLPVFVEPGQDRVEVDDKPVVWARSVRGRGGSETSRASAQAAGERLYVALNKPRGVICTTDDPQGRPTVLDLLPKGLLRGRGRLYPVGRLDADSTGLMLLTNDGELANRLTHPRYGVAKQYVVSVRGNVTVEDLERLRRGLYLAREGGGARKARAAQVRILKHEQDRARGDRTQLVVTLREGQNREIRRMLERLGHKVRRLERVAIGPLRLKGLARRQSRMLTAGEVRELRKAGLGNHP